MRKGIRRLGLAALLLAGLMQGTTAGTLETVKQRSVLRCGVEGSIPGLSLKDKDGRWSGLDVDFCRAVAAAALADAEKVDFVTLDNKGRLSALAKGEVDLLSRNTTWTMERDLGQGVDFVGVLYFDGQGFIVPRDSGKISVLELGGASICVPTNSTSESNLQRYFARHRMTYQMVGTDSSVAARDAYLSGKCDAFTTDQSQLHALRSTLPDPHAHKILPEVISKEPLAPAVRSGDPNWRDIVEWTLYALIDAEELGIDSANADRIREQAQSPDIRYFLDLDGASAKSLGLEPLWTYRVIKAVGNYGEIFERTLGKGSVLGIQRGMNALWRDGGLLYAPPPR